MQCNLVQLLLKTVDSAIVSIVVIVMAHPIVHHDGTCRIFLDSRELARISHVIENRVLHPVRCLADREGERASDGHFGNDFLLNSLKTCGMIPDLAVPNADLTV